MAMAGMKLQEALELTAKVLVKTMDTASPTAERLEFGIVPGKEGMNIYPYIPIVINCD